MADGKVTIVIEADAQDVDKTVGQVRKELESLDNANTGKPFKKLSDEAISFAGKASVALATTSLAVAGFSLKSAGDLQALEAQFEQVFDGMNDAASKSLNSIAKETHMLPNRLKGSFTQMAAFAKTAGMDTKEALDLSSRATLAAADSAAFYDKSIEEVTESLQSFLKGNFENDAALGISATETTRNAAANKLYGKSFIELDEAQKQLTLLQMVEDGNKLSGALGQASREADGMENVMGNMKRTIVDLAAAFGMPLLDPFLNGVKKLTSLMSSLATKLQENPALVYAIVGAIGTLIAAFGAVWLKGKGLALILKGIGTAMAVITSPVFLIVAAIGALVTAIVYFYKTSEKFRNGLNNLIKPVKNVVTGIGLMVKAFKELFSNGPGPKIAELRGQFLKLFPEKVWNDFMKFSGALMDMKNGASVLMKAFSEMITNGPGPKIAELRNEFGTMFPTEIFDKAVKLASSFKDLGLAIGAIVGIAKGSIKSISDLDGVLGGAFGEKGTNLIMAMGNALKGVIEEVKLFGSAIKTAFTTGDFQPLLESFAKILPTIMTMLIGGLPGLLITGSKLITTIADGMGVTVPELLSKVTEVITSMIEGFTSMLPTLLETGIGIVTAILEGLISAFPAILEVVVSVITTLITAFTEMLPVILEIGIQLIMSLIEGFVAAFPTLIESVVTIILTLVTALLENLPSIIAAGIKLLLALIQGLLQVLPQLIAAGISLIISLIGAILQNLPQILAAGIKLIGALIKGLAQMLGALLAMGAQLIGALISEIASFFGKMLSKGGELIMKLINGIKGKIGSAKAAVTSVLQGILGGIKGFFGQFKNAGSTIVGMIADGIKGAVGKVTSAISGITQKIRNFLPFSPAKEGALRDLHRLNFGGTISTGIYAAERQVKNAMGHLADSMNNELVDGMPDVSLDTVFGGNTKIGSTGALNATVNNHHSTATNDQPVIVYVDSIVELDGKEVGRGTAKHVEMITARNKRSAARLRGEVY